MSYETPPIGTGNRSTGTRLVTTLLSTPPSYVDIIQYDLHLCAYTALLRIVAQFHNDIFSDPDSPTGLNKVRITINIRTTFYH